MSARQPVPAHSEELATLLREYLSILSHDVRTPMTAIKGAAGLLEVGIGGTLTAHQAKLVDICRRNADLATLLVQDVVGLLRLHSGLEEVHPTSFDMVAEVQEMWSVLASQTTLPLRIENSGDAALLHTDRHYFRWAVGALIRFPQPYADVEEASLALRTLPDGGEIALTCSPFSVEQADIDRLLTTMVRGRRQVKGRLQVSGLELPFLQALSLRFSTTLSVDSVPPESLRIRLIWPTMAV